MQLFYVWVLENVLWNFCLHNFNNFNMITKVKLEVVAHYLRIPAL